MWAMRIHPETLEEKAAITHFLGTEGEGLKKANPEFWNYVRALTD